MTAVEEPGTAEAERDAASARRRSRRSSLAFYSFVSLGIAAGAALWVYSIIDQPAVRLEPLRVLDEASSSRVQTLARNHSDETTYCIEVEMAAVDVDGYTLEEVPATSTEGNAVRPGQTLNFVAVFTGLDEQERTEELDDYIAYITEREPC